MSEFLEEICTEFSFVCACTCLRGCWGGESVCGGVVCECLCVRERTTERARVGFLVNSLDCLQT